MPPSPPSASSGPASGPGPQHQAPRKKPTVSYGDILKGLDLFDMVPEGMFAVKEDVTPLAAAKRLVMLALGMSLAAFICFGVMYHFYRALDLTEVVKIADFDGKEDFLRPCGSVTKDEEKEDLCGFAQGGADGGLGKGCEMLSAVPARTMEFECHAGGNINVSLPCSDPAATGFGGMFVYELEATAADRKRAAISIPPKFFKTHDECMEQFDCAVAASDVASGAAFAPSKVAVAKWLYDFGGTDYSSPTEGKDGTIYVGSHNGVLHAVNPKLGSGKWKYQTSGEVLSTPTVDPNDGTIYIGSRDNYLHAVNPKDGSEKWKYETGGDVFSSAAVDPKDGTIYVSSEDNYLYAINPQDGSEKWKYQTGGNQLRSMPTVDPKDGTIYVSSVYGYLYAINPQDGSEKWNTGGGVTTPTVDPNDGTIYVGSEDNYLYAINPQDGSEKWKYQTGGAVFSTPTVDPKDGTIYVSSEDNYLYAINPQDGSEKWKHIVGGWCDGLVFDPKDGTIYLGCGEGDNYVKAVNSDGSEKWKYETGGVGDTYNMAPGIGSDGTLYISGDTSKYLHAIIPADHFACGIETISAGELELPLTFSQPIFPPATHVRRDRREGSGSDNYNNSGADVSQTLLAADQQKACADSFNANFCDRNFERLKETFCSAYQNHPPYICTKEEKKGRFEAISLALGLAQLLYMIMLFVVTRILWVCHRNKKNDDGSSSSTRSRSRSSSTGSAASTAAGSAPYFSGNTQTQAALIESNTRKIEALEAAMLRNGALSSIPAPVPAPAPVPTILPVTTANAPAPAPPAAQRAAAPPVQSTLVVNTAFDATATAVVEAAAAVPVPIPAPSAAPHESSTNAALPVPTPAPSTAPNESSTDAAVPVPTSAPSAAPNESSTDAAVPTPPPAAATPVPAASTPGITNNASASNAPAPSESEAAPLPPPPTPSSSSAAAPVAAAAAASPESPAAAAAAAAPPATDAVAELTTYEALYLKAAASKSDEISAAQVATLLKESGLGSKVLRRVWNDAKNAAGVVHASSTGKMNFAEFVAACKLGVAAGGSFA